MSKNVANWWLAEICLCHFWVSSLFFFFTHFYARRKPKKIPKIQKNTPTKLSNMIRSEQTSKCAHFKEWIWKCAHTVPTWSKTEKRNRGPVCRFGWKSEKDFWSPIFWHSLGGLFWVRTHCSMAREWNGVRQCEISTWSKQLSVASRLISFPCQLRS